jgi:hypothetical protein
VIGGRVTAKKEDEEQLTRERNKDIETFTQRLSPVATENTFKPGYFLQSGVGHKQQYVMIHKHSNWC